MKFKDVLNEKTKPGHKRIAAAHDTSPESAKNYLKKLDKEENGEWMDNLEKKAKKAKDPEAYKWSVIHKRMKGHFGE